MKKGVKNVIIGARIKELRETNKMTLEELGMRIHASKSNISKYESGTIAVPYEKIEALASVFNVHPAYLMGWDAELESGSYKIAEGSGTSDSFILANMDKDEIDLILKYRKLNSVGKKKLHDNADDYLNLEKYTSQEKNASSFA